MILFSATAASCDDAPEVALAAATRTSVSEVVEAPASVTAKGSATVSSPANGTLAALDVSPGQTVASGQVIGVIDSPEAQTRLAQAAEALAAAKRSSASSGGSAKLNLGAAQQHLDASAGAAFAEARAAAEKIPDPEHRQAVLARIATAEAGYAGVSQNAWQLIRGVERGLASVGSAMRALGAAQVMQAQQAYDLAKATVDGLTLKAPMAGVVQFGGASSSPAAPGVPNLPGDLSSLLGGAGAATGGGTDAGVSTQVSAGSRVKTGTAIATIVDVSELGLLAEVDETDVLLVKEGLKADAELDAAPGARLEATVRAIDVLPTPNSRGAVAYKVHLVLSPSGVRPRPGMSALVRLRVRESANTVAVPAAAVFSADGKDWVWVRSGNGTAHRRAVRIGVAGRDLLEITEGLGDGERVVVKGADRVREGDRLP